MANIFLFATSELSQDAFLCWLFASLGGDKDGVFKRTDDEQVYKIARYVLFKLLGLKDSPETKVALSWVQKQWKDLDVAVDVFIDNELYVLGIEDKTRSYIHNSSGTKECQLKKYRGDLLAFWKNEKSNKKRGYFAKPEHIKTIVYKTSFFSEDELKKVDDWDYYNIEDIIKLFKEIVPSSKDVQNDFLRNYLEKLYFIDDTFNENSNIYDWEIWRNRDYDISWEKFFIDFQEYAKDYKFVCKYSYYLGSSLSSCMYYNDDKLRLPCIIFTPRNFWKKDGRRLLFCVKIYYDYGNVKDNELDYIKNFRDKIRKIGGISLKRTKTSPNDAKNENDKDEKYASLGNYEISLDEITKIDVKTGEKTISKEDLKEFMVKCLRKFYSAFDECKF